MISLDNAKMEELFEAANRQGTDVAIELYQQEIAALAKAARVMRAHKVKHTTTGDKIQVVLEVPFTPKANSDLGFMDAQILFCSGQGNVEERADVNQEAAASEDQADLFEGDGDTEQAPPEIIIDGEIHQLVPITEEPDTADMVVDANGEVFEIDEITIGEDAVTSFALTPLGDENPSETVTFDDLKECFRLAEPTGKQSAELTIEDLTEGNTIRLIEDMGMYPIGTEFNVVGLFLDTGKVTCTEIVGDTPEATLCGDGQPFTIDAEHIAALFLKVSDQN